jgi:hypothetical protein
LPGAQGERLGGSSLILYLSAGIIFEKLGRKVPCSGTSHNTTTSLSSFALRLAALAAAATAVAGDIPERMPSSVAGRFAILNAFFISYFSDIVNNFHI